MAENADYNASPIRCFACEAIEASNRALHGVEEPDPTLGMKTRVEPGAPHGDQP